MKCSDVFRWFLGGWIAYTPDVMCSTHRTSTRTNRYVDASWAPHTACLSYDNRTAGFRVVGHDRAFARVPQSLVPTVNPDWRLPRHCSRAGSIREPDGTARVLSGDVYAHDICSRTRYLKEATDTFAASAFAKVRSALTSWNIRAFLRTEKPPSG